MALAILGVNRIIIRWSGLAEAALDFVKKISVACSKLRLEFHWVNFLSFMSASKAKV